MRRRLEEGTTGASDAGGAAPTVSVIVIGYNQEQYAVLAVASVLRQSYKNLECIFVDDGSTDGTAAAVTALTDVDPRLRVYTKENRGPSAARNFGARHASPSSRFLAFLDGDDEMTPDFVEILVAHLAANPATGVVLPGSESIDGDGNRLERTPQRRWVPGWFGQFPRKLRDEETATPFVNFYCGTGAKPFWLSRREVYESIAGWNEGLWPFEDNEILAQFALVTRVDYLARPLVRYRVHSSQITHHSNKKPRWYVDGGLELLQAQFNSRMYPDASVERVVDQACRYYRQIHLPLRHARVATKSLVEAVVELSLRKLIRAIELYGEFVRDLILYRVLFWRARRTYPG